MSNTRKLMPPLRENPNPSPEPVPLITAYMSSGELPEGDLTEVWDRITIRNQHVE